MSKSSITRKFLGKTEEFISKEEQRFEQKHLKAYLKGHNTFTFGRDEHRNPIIHTVKQELYDK